ncbi:Replication protein A DNA-binding subunit [Armadillidium nasatum]|uniref:Replication protein A DNA-binding subunit n=1 Tax=Armadillidium nasatum TaxID=96803 RepID=A0A5N5TAY2_9CRUS|nr:Replication protein A DNA-binding subunit [Armadillidium nasatum]
MISTFNIVIILNLDSLQIGVEDNSIMGNLSQYETSPRQGVSGNATSNYSQDLFGLSTASRCSSFAGGSSETPAGVFPISSLTPEKKTWTIRALVTCKSSLIPYDSNGKKCKRFFIDLADESGEIRAKAFDKQCKKFWNVIKPNKTYSITQSIVLKADKRYNSLKNDYEIIFDSRTMVGLTLWESQAENFTGSQNSVIVVKGAKVTDFRGRNLSVATSSIIQIDPNIEESYKLRRWYEGRDCNLEGNSQIENFLKFGRCN